MKKTFALLLCIAFYSFAGAQSFEIGGRYLAISNWFFNSNVTNSGGTATSIPEDYAAVYSYSYGLHLAYNFTDHTGLETDVMLATLAQSYTGNFPESGVLSPTGEPTNVYNYNSGEEYKSTTTINTIQIPLFFRFLSGNGAYAEIGPQIDIVSSANYSATYKDGPVSSANFNVTGGYPGSYFSGVLAFGNNIRLAHSFFFNINLRLAYDFTDIKGVDALGQNLNNNVLYSGSNPFYGKYEATNAVSASFGVGLIYRFGHDF